ncbi:hypothetical protein OROGR_013418 [Orobanche gracilis]
MNFVSILSESFKVISKNAKLMSLVALFSVVLISSVFVSYFYSLKSLLIGMFVTYQQSFMPNPDSSRMPDSAAPGFGLDQFTSPFRHLHEDLAIVLAVEIAFCLVFFIISFFSSISTILVSAMSYKSKNSSLKELLSIVCRKWTRPLITTFYVSTLVAGYFFIVSMPVTPLLMYRNYITLPVAISIGVIALVFYLYLSVSWALAVVVSVVEDSFYGIEALGKAEALVKGKRLQGFLINLCSNLFVLIVFRCYKSLLGGDKGLFEYRMSSGLFVFNFLALVKIFVAVAYTILYFECKELHGEEIELYVDVEYSKVHNMELGNNMA